jgi:hypothetical protein
MSLKYVAFMDVDKTLWEQDVDIQQLLKHDLQERAIKTANKKDPLFEVNSFNQKVSFQVLTPEQHPDFIRLRRPYYRISCILRRFETINGNKNG